MIENSILQDLIEKAKDVRKFAYCPYSGIAVGAALLTDGGEVFTGTNIENSAFTPGLCAERVAFSKALSQGVRAFSAIAVVGGEKGQDTTEPFPPCGVCRQFISEFVSDDFAVVLQDGRGGITVYDFKDIFPFSFGKDNLK